MYLNYHSLTTENPDHSQKKTTVNVSYKNRVCYYNFDTYKWLILVTKIHNIFSKIVVLT